MTLTSKKIGLLVLAFICIVGLAIIIYFLIDEFNVGRTFKASNMTKVYPEEIKEPLSNPGMGWVLIDYAIDKRTDNIKFPNKINPGPYWTRITSSEQTMPKVDNIAICSTWEELEPNEGKFYWDTLDKTIEYWSNLGKRIHFRISTDPYSYGNGYLGRSDVGFWSYCSGAPKWLEKYQIKYTDRSSSERYYDITNSTYIEKMKNFVQALAQRYRNNPNIDIVDLRGYGKWGEWHSGYTPIESYKIRSEALKKIIDVWYSAWKGKKILAVSASYEFLDESYMKPDCSNPSTFLDFKKWSAFDYALTKENLTFRRDGLGGAVWKYDKQLLEEFWSKGKSLPIIGEFWRGYHWYKVPSDNTASYDAETAYEDALLYHPNYLTLQGWDVDTSASDFYKEKQDIVLDGLTRMGYRITLNEASYSGTIVRNGVLILEQKWENKGVGKCCVKYPLKAYLFDKSGKEIWSGIDKSINQSEWVKGKVFEYKSTFEIPKSIAEGKYELFIAMVDEKTGSPAISLAIKGDSKKKMYKLGDVSVSKTLDSSKTEQNIDLVSRVENQEKQIVDFCGNGILGKGSNIQEFYEFYHSNERGIFLTGGHKYIAYVDYTVQTPSRGNGGIFTVARSVTNDTTKDVGFLLWNDWTMQIRSPMTRVLVFDLREQKGDYYIIFGCKNGGDVILKNIIIKEHE
jgi:hypothetical protein